MKTSVVCGFTGAPQDMGATVVTTRGLGINSRYAKVTPCISSGHVCHTVTSSNNG